jgi:hypothetical protein
MPCERLTRACVCAHGEGRYNESVPQHALPCDGSRLAVLVGNSRALWPRFLEHVASLKARAVPIRPCRRRALAAIASGCGAQATVGRSPLDDYLHESVGAAFAPVRPLLTRFYHNTEPGTRARTHTCMACACACVCTHAPRERASLFL